MERRPTGRSEILQNVGDQRVRKVPGEPVEGRSFLLKNLGVVRVDLIFLVKNVPGIGEQDLVAMLIHQANVRGHHHLHSRGGTGVLIESDHAAGDVLNRSLHYSVSVVRLCHHPEVRRFDQFANDGGRQLLFDAKSLRLIGKGRNGDRLDVRRQPVASARNVISAAGGARRCEQESELPG